MPEGFGSSYAGSLQTVFAYVTVPQARTAGIKDMAADPIFGIDDDRLRGLIRDMSHKINRLTDQWFLPIRLREKVDGNRSSVARMPNLIPILELFSLRAERTGLISLTYPSVAYQVKQRYVMMVTRNVRLPEYPHFIVLDGVFGWLADDFVARRTTLALPASSLTSPISVVDATKIRVGDTIVIGAEPEPKSFHAIVEAVDISGSPHTLTFDPALVPPDADVPAGAPVVKYGRVIDDIQRACLLMVRDRVQKIGDIDTAESPFGIGTRLNSESVEGYSYSLTPMKAIHSHAGGSWTSGNAEVDDILQAYSTPSMYVGYA